MTNNFKDVWKKIDIKSDNDCWEWVGYVENCGYGRMCFDYRNHLVHRVVYELIYGPIPEGMLICHHCDNKKCCNPKHLFLGTQGDNMRDMWKKYREGNGLRKLTTNHVVEIRKLYLTGKYYQWELGEMFGVDQSNICDIINNKIWREK